MGMNMTKNNDLQLKKEHELKSIDKEKIQINEYELRKAKRIKTLELRNPLKDHELRVTMDLSSKLIVEVIPKK